MGEKGHNSGDGYAVTADELRQFIERAEQLAGEKRGHIRELWSRRPLAGWVKSAANKVLSRRLERKRLKRATLAQKDNSHE